MSPDAKKLTHLPQNDGLTEFIIPVLVTGIRHITVKAATQSEAVQQVEKQTVTNNTYSAGALSEFTAHALAPTLALKPEDRESWPYWAYGWYGTDGIDWHSYRTNKGPKGIPGIAEESWPIPPYEN